MRAFVFITLFIALGYRSALAQSIANDAPVQGMTNEPGVLATNAAPAFAKEAAEKAWAFEASVYTYVVPDSRVTLQPTFIADRGWLHLEARFNYESLDTGSAWIGYNFTLGEKLRFEITPMLGGVFGKTSGIAPGYKATLAWWKLELSTEGEYLFDTRASSDSFFYNWSELSIYPLDWFRFGGVVQRTKLYQSDFDIQRGLLAGLSFKRINVTTYVFNPDDEPTFVFAVGTSF
jgi:hypothetical protein